MRIMLICSSYNSLTQRAHTELRAAGHEVTVEIAISDGQLREGIGLFKPDLIVCPMLTYILPKDIPAATPCLIVHPGIEGDRGAASLDWAILNREKEWGVTIMEARDPVDSGPIWASYRFPMRAGSKSSLYRREVTAAGVKAILTAVQRFENGFVPAPLDYSQQSAQGRYRPTLKQAQRAIDWQTDTVEIILRKIRAADSYPGVLDTILGEQYYVYGAHQEGVLLGDPGTLVAQRNGAICRAAVDGAVWITHLRRKGPSCGADATFKLPAAMVLGDQIAGVPEVPVGPLHGAQPGRWARAKTKTYQDIWYEECDDVGFVHFDFYNGAMSTSDCERLLEAVSYARSRPVRVIVLQGGRDFWSNGIHLNVIEAAPDPAQESWRNINAMDDLCHAIITATDHLVIAALHGNAGAGGVMLALTADQVVARDGIVLNPHYKAMGGLYGSEYWTYTLPRRVGAARAITLTEECLPVNTREAREMGLIDAIIFEDQSGAAGFDAQVRRFALHLAHAPDYQALLETKRRERHEDEEKKALAEYRTEELARMRENFFGRDPSYHLARRKFVQKVRPDKTPEHLARHRGKNNRRLLLSA